MVSNFELLMGFENVRYFAICNAKYLAEKAVTDRITNGKFVKAKLEDYEK